MALGSKERTASRNRAKRGLTSQSGLTNGAVSGAPAGLEVDRGLINGLPSAKGERPRSGRGLFAVSKRRRRAARRILDQKASEPLPGTDDE
jgi:hypothetical protein